MEAAIVAAMAASPASLTIVILTRNEDRHIARAIESVRAIAERIIVIDSGSTDDTCALASELGAEVFERAWVNYADQFQWALDHCEITTDWTMRLDADEWLGADLVAELADCLPNLPETITGISLDRRQYFLGRWIRHGGRFPLRLLRIWRTGLGRIEHRWMDEHIIVEQGDLTHIDGEFVDDNQHGLIYFTDKHNRYATREALDALIGKYGLFDQPKGTDFASTEQAGKMRNRKTRWYNQLPTGLGPLLYFLYRYFPKLGFLDGRAGLIYHVLQGFWYRFLVDAKRVELELAMAGAKDDVTRIDILTRMTGHNLRAFHKSRSVQVGDLPGPSEQRPLA